MGFLLSVFHVVFSNPLGYELGVSLSPGGELCFPHLSSMGNTTLSYTSLLPNTTNTILCINGQIARDFRHGNVKVSLNRTFYNENCLIPKIPPIPPFQRGGLQSPPLLKGDPPANAWLAAELLCRHIRQWRAGLGGFFMLAQCDFDGALGFSWSTNTTTLTTSSPSARTRSMAFFLMRCRT